MNFFDNGGDVCVWDEWDNRVLIRDCYEGILLPRKYRERERERERERVTKYINLSIMTYEL